MSEPLNEVDIIIESLIQMREYALEEGDTLLVDELTQMPVFFENQFGQEVESTADMFELQAQLMEKVIELSSFIRNNWDATRGIVDFPIISERDHE